MRQSGAMVTRGFETSGDILDDFAAEQRRKPSYPDVTVEMTPEQMCVAIDARQALDVLRDIEEGKTDQLPVKEEVLKPAADGTPPPSTTPTTQEAKKDLLSIDPQLSAAVLVLRLQLAGASL